MMDDLISRQAAIDAVDNFSMEVIEEMRITARTTVTACTGERYTMTKEEVKDLLNGLPPADDVAEITRCKDCKWFNDIGCSIDIADDSDRPTENDFCSFAERRTDE